MVKFIQVYWLFQVIWLKKDVPVITSQRVVELSTNNKHTLLIRTVQPLDFGYFKCRATNALGASEQIIQLSGMWLSFIYFQNLEEVLSTYHVHVTWKDWRSEIRFSVTQVHYWLIFITSLHRVLTINKQRRHHVSLLISLYRKFESENITLIKVYKF
jgi:hypothetical protein